MIDDIFPTEELPHIRVYEAAQQVVRDYMRRECKKIDWVAERLGTTRGYLYAILQPARTDKPMSVDMALRITRLTGDMRIIEEMAREFGFALCRPEPLAKPASITAKTLDIQERVGRLAATVRDALEDGVLDDSERAQIADIAHELRKIAADIELGAKEAK